MAFMDIFLDALPFMILGVLLSTIVENFIPEGVIQRMTPKHPLRRRFIRLCAGHYVSAL